MKSKTVLAILSVIAAFVPVATAQELKVAAAADLQSVFQEVGARFQKVTGTSVKLSYGSSGNFFTQIQNGAPFDAFFSADIDYPRKLEAAGLTEPGTLYSYGTGKIVLWVPADSQVDVNNGLQALLDPSIKKIAIANPEHAPYGRAAVAALKHENLYDKVSAKFVLGENISQTMSFVSSGSAEAGIVAMSLAMSPALRGKGRYAEIPGDWYSLIEQGAVVLKNSPNKQLARQFLEFVKSRAIQELLREYGFSVPSSSLQSK